MTPTQPLTGVSGRALLDALVDVNGPEEPTPAQLDRLAVAYRAAEGAPRRTDFPARRPRGGSR